MTNKAATEDAQIATVFVYGYSAGNKPFYKVGKRKKSNLRVGHCC